MSERCKIICADVLKWAAEYDGDPFSAVLTDPPYHLTSIQRRFGKDGSAPAQEGKDGAFRRLSSGFMGQQWDGVAEDGLGVASRPETWAAIASVLHPGAFLFAFAGSRGWHRQAVAMEDAGLIMHPSLFRLWAYGSGFPKATRVKDERFAGHRYGLQALKPAAEPILCFQKPYKGSPVDCMTSTGAGALNIDGGRIGTGGKMWATPRGGIWQTDAAAKSALIDNPLGRWPANLCLDEHGAAAMDRMSGISGGGQYVGPNARERNNGIGMGSGPKLSGASLAPDNFGDQGGASRFFLNTDWQPEDAEAFLYTAKAGREERDAGLEAIHSPAFGSSHGDGMGRGISNTRQDWQRGNPHPCVKPLRLTKWLAMLLLPPAEYAPRRILIPFSGSGSEAIGAQLAGWDEIVGVEMSEEYAEIARARARFWSGNVGLFESLAATQDEAPAQEEMAFT